jgi:NTP pyrophosphatase (non-canonical NTP hydrolase)
MPSLRSVLIVSLTLRDAQHLSWKTFKKFQTLDPERSNDLLSGTELVQKAKEVTEKIDKLNLSEAISGKEEIGKLSSELIFAAFILAEHAGVDLEESFLQTIDEIILGFVS